MLRVPSTTVCVMIRAPLARFGLAALLCSLAPNAFAQQQPPAQQRSRTEPKPKPAEPIQQRSTGSTQKPGTSSTPQKPGSTSTAQQKPGSGSTAKPGASSTTSKPGAAGPAKPGAAAGP